MRQINISGANSIFKWCYFKMADDTNVLFIRGNGNVCMVMET